MTDFAAWNEEQANAVIAEMATERGALLPVLHALQEKFGYIPDAAIPLIGEGLNLTPSDVLGVIGFYHEFRRSLPPSPLVRVCRAEACRAQGVASLLARAEAEQIEVEDVYCFGNCALGPTVEIAGKLYGRMDEDRFVKLVRDAS